MENLVDEKDSPPQFHNITLLLAVHATTAYSSHVPFDTTTAENKKQMLPVIAHIHTIENIGGQVQ